MTSERYDAVIVGAGFGGIGAAIQLDKAGLGDYQVRTWGGWHHHQALSLIAAWFLTREARRGEKADPGPDGATGPASDRPALASRA